MNLDLWEYCIRKSYHEITSWLLIYQQYLLSLHQSSKLEQSLVESVLSSLVITPHYFISNHLSVFMDCVVVLSGVYDGREKYWLITMIITVSPCKQFVVFSNKRRWIWLVEIWWRNIVRMSFCWYIHPLISQYLPIISERVFPGKETVVEFLGGLIEKSIETIDASEIQEWILWILRETYTLAASYSGDVWALSTTLKSDCKREASRHRNSMECRLSH